MEFIIKFADAFQFLERPSDHFAGTVRCIVPRGLMHIFDRFGDLLGVDELLVPAFNLFILAFREISAFNLSDLIFEE